MGIGKVAIEARFERLGASSDVLVSPAGTYAVSGYVKPATTAIRPRVSVSGGTGPAQTVETRFDGYYVLLGVAGRVRVSVALDGFSTQSVDLDVVSDVSQDFALPLAGGDIWRLTIEPSGRCGQVLPAGMPVVRSEVRLVFREALILMAPVEAPDTTFFGTLTANGLSLLMAGAEDCCDFYPPEVQMRASDGAPFQVLGRFDGTREGGGFSGRFSGYISGGSDPVGSVPYCYESDHRADLSPR